MQHWWFVWRRSPSLWRESLLAAGSLWEVSLSAAVLSPSGSEPLAPQSLPVLGWSEVLLGSLGNTNLDVRWTQKREKLCISHWLFQLPYLDHCLWWWWGVQSAGSRSRALSGICSTLWAASVAADKSRPHSEERWRNQISYSWPPGL